MNEFLKNRGYVDTTRGGTSIPSWSTVVRGHLMHGEDGVEGAPSLFERTLSIAAQFGLTSQRMGRALELVGLDELALKYVPDNAIRAGTEHVSFSDSTAYMRSRIECGIRINLDGREPEGVVSQEEYEPVREALIEDLRALQTPDDEPVFDVVGQREEFFEGPYVSDAPDIMLVPADYDQYLSALLLGEKFSEPSQPYNHKRDGIIAATGTRIDASMDVTDAHLFDVAPTVLATLGVPSSERMDGTTLPFVDPVGTKEYPPFEADAIVPTNSQHVEQRLTDLGYLE